MLLFLYFVMYVPFNFFSSAFKGVVWLLESGKISKLSRKQKTKIEILEVSPVKMGK